MSQKPIDPFDMVRAMQAKQRTCLHPKVTHLLGRTGPWRAYCNDCGHVRVLTAEECAAHDDEITNSVSKAR